MNYSDKFLSFRNKTIFEKLPRTQQQIIRDLAFHFSFTFQDFKQVSEALRDLTMWNDKETENAVTTFQNKFPERTRQAKKSFLADLDRRLNRLRASLKIYPEKTPQSSQLRKPPVRMKSQNIKKTFFGKCPVASEKTMCCQLYTLDAIERCPFGCSYCTIQTFYGRTIRFIKDLEKALKTIRLDPEKFYHIGTGQSSDSLAFGNTYGMLDALCAFAEEHPNVLLELKTKSGNTDYFVRGTFPKNIVVSWSLNTQKIISNEEHFTASLEERLQAAKAVSSNGVAVAFHFHPMIYYKGWDKDYPDIAERIMNDFSPENLRFISFGSLTLIKPVIRKLRELGIPSKILQMEMVKDPHGKLTYPDNIKVVMFKKLYHAFSPWHRKLFFYLCMEKRSIWEDAFGWSFADNGEFEKVFSQLY
ncbi:hypothetical protein JW979_13090 [bacterium]|nr:hypothetical protein [candidate division CSSED10-310 bacterium]